MTANYSTRHEYKYRQKLISIHKKEVITDEEHQIKNKL
jgi:hypothetical protein